MIEEGRPTVDVLTQLIAVQGALELVALGLVEQHAMHCLLGDGDAPGEPRQQVDELMAAVGRLMRRSARGDAGA